MGPHVRWTVWRHRGRPEAFGPQTCLLLSVRAPWRAWSRKPFRLLPRGPFSTSGGQRGEVSGVGGQKQPVPAGPDAAGAIRRAGGGHTHRTGRCSPVTRPTSRAAVAMETTAKLERDGARSSLRQNARLRRGREGGTDPGPGTSSRGSDHSVHLKYMSVGALHRQKPGA